MESRRPDPRLSRLAAAIAEPARTRMLCSLLDGRARTSTELAIVGGVTPSTASVHLARLTGEQLVRTDSQGRHRYHRLAGPDVARALEALMAVAGGARDRFTPNTPSRLRTARTCYDHMAGEVAVSLHDRLRELRWLASDAPPDGSYDLTREGETRLGALGIDLETARARRRRFAYSCIDWSERKPHVGGALGAALLAWAVRRRWVVPELDSRALSVTPLGRRELRGRFGVLS